MADFLVTEPKGPDPLAGVEDAILEKFLNEFDPSNPDRVLEIDAPADAVPEPLPPVEETIDPPVEAAPPAAEPEPEPEIDLSASEKEGERIAREALQAKVALLEAHNSRLAGKIGFFEQKLNTIPQATEPYQPETQAEVDRLTSLEQRLDQEKAMRVRAEVSQAVNSAVAELDGTWSTELAPEIQAVVPKYADQIQAARDATDPALARQIATAVGLLVKADAMQMKWETTHKALVERKATTAPATAKAKQAAAASGAGSVPTPAPKQVSFADMTAAEADAWLRENVR